MTNLEDIPELFAPRYSRGNMNNSRDTLEGVGEVALNEVLDDDDVDLVAVLGIRLPQGISLSGSHDSNEVFSEVANRNVMDLITLERGTPLSRGVLKCANRCIQTLQ